MAREREWGRFDRERARAAARLATRLATDREKLALILSPLEETMAFASALAAARPRARTRAASAGDERAAMRRARLPRVDRAAVGQRRRRPRTSRPPGASGASAPASAERHIRELTLRGEVALETGGTRVGVVNGSRCSAPATSSSGSRCGSPRSSRSGARGSSTSSARRSSAAASTPRASPSCAATWRACSGRSGRSRCARSSRSSRATARSTATARRSSELFAVLSALADVGDRPGASP